MITGDHPLTAAAIARDLGIQSGLIATNARELAALRELGERVYTEFTIAKSKDAQKVGDLQIKLTKTDPARRDYNLMAHGASHRKRMVSMSATVGFGISPNRSVR